ncbi:unnamed protein product, partial [Prorocentrum cordatum]
SAARLHDPVARVRDDTARQPRVPLAQHGLQLWRILRRGARQVREDDEHWPAGVREVLSRFRPLAAGGHRGQSDLR